MENKGGFWIGFFAAFCFFIVCAFVAVILMMTDDAFIKSLAQESDDDTEARPVEAAAEPKRVVFVHSYDESSIRSQMIMEGLNSIFDFTDNLDVHVIYMNTQYVTDEAVIIAAANDARRQITAIDPDVLMIADDDAFNYLVSKYYRDTDLPVVFIGLKEDAAFYGLPYANTTGMFQKPLSPELYELVESFSHGARVGVLSHDIDRAHQNLSRFEEENSLVFHEKRFVLTMDEWVSAFIEMQESVDLLFLNGYAIEDWNDEIAATTALQHTRIPSGAMSVSMMDMSLVGLTPASREHGAWAAKAAVDLMNGARVEDVPMINHGEARIWVNLDIAEKLEILFPVEILKNANVY